MRRRAVGDHLAAGNHWIKLIAKDAITTRLSDSLTACAILLTGLLWPPAVVVAASPMRR